MAVINMPRGLHNRCKICFATADWVDTGV